MSCARCGRSNPVEARFCGGCGVALVARCPSCAAVCESGQRFCTSCGSTLATPAGGAATAEPPAVARKVVTVVFADLIGSVALHERLDAESGRRAMERYHRAMATAVEAHGGRVLQLLGDGVLAAFGVPRVAEDDAIRAVRAAVAMQGAFRDLVRSEGDGGPLAGVGLRVAVNTGEMVVGDDETVIGDTTNVAARLQHEASDGDVLIGEGTQRLIADLVTLLPLGAFVLRGRAETVRAWRVVSLARPASARASVFVGREAELGRLRAVWDGAVAARAARLAVLLGSPGLGKSRLVAEIARRAGAHATVLSARCDAAGGATFAPLARALRDFLHVADADGDDVLRGAIESVVPGDAAERVRITAGVAALCSGAPSSPEETFFAVRRMLAALAGARPLVLILDDLHWAAPLLLDLVEHLVQWSSDAPLLVLAAARPELRDVRPSLTTPGGLAADVVTLGGLDAASSMQLAAGVLGASELPAAIVGRVLATSEGNPLFLAELVRMLVQDGVLRRDGERWLTTVEVAQLDMPPTIHVLLAARLERLRPDERLLLERAAVIGRRFSRAALAHLVGGDPAALDARLAVLQRSELIEPDTGWFLGDPALRFHHVLIRDAAYRRVLKETRAELHERAARWIAERARTVPGLDHDETLGWHFEQAHLHLSELGPLDARGRALGESAAQHLGAAGGAALARDDVALAAALLGRAIAALEPGHAMRADLVPDWCEALLAAGEVDTAVAAIAELERIAGGSERLRAWHACFAGQRAALVDPQSLRATADRVAAAAEVLAAAGDAHGEAKAYAVHAGALARLGAMGACEASLDRALAAARRARDRRRANSVLAGAPVAALWGPSPVTRASGRCLDVVRVLRITQGAPAVEAVALRCQAVLEALRGRGEAARRMVASSRRMVEELGLAQQLLEADVFAGMIELLEGEAVAAERWLASAYAGLREHGLAIDAARAAALLGRALLAQGRAADAERLSHDSESLAGDDLKAAIAWRGVRAAALARRGETTAAMALARAAVQIAAATDALLDHADARVALAATLRAAGRDAEALAEERHAAELWRAKGATLLLERAPQEALREPRADVAPDVRRRSPRQNLATAEVARLEAVVARRDLAAVEQMFAALVESVHNPLGVTWNSAGAVESFRILPQGSDLGYRHQTLATLGERLALSRQVVSSTGIRRDGFDIGELQAEQLWLNEVDGQGRRIWSECFATNQLARAVVRLYERHADLQPDAVRAARAAGTARALDRLFALDVSAAETGLRDDVVLVDRRRLGLGRVIGPDALRRQSRAVHELARDLVLGVDEIVALDDDLLLLRLTLRGLDRASGGAFEQSRLELRVFAADGATARIEWFDADDVATALARHDVLSGSAAAPENPTGLRENFATAHVRRLDAIWADGDVAAFDDIFGSQLVVVHHPMGATYGFEASVLRFREMFDEPGKLDFRHEPLATLGDELALCRVRSSASSLVYQDIDAGAFEIEYVVVVRADAGARALHVEVFATDRLGEAVVRFYELHAAAVRESALAGHDGGRDGLDERRTAAIARAVAAVVPMDVDAIAGVLHPELQFTDHRRLGLGSGRGAERYLRGLRSLTELAHHAAAATTRVLAAGAHALLLDWHTTGVDRTSDGIFAIDMLMLWTFDADGRISDVELFDVDDEVTARTRAGEVASRARGGAPSHESGAAMLASDAALARRDRDALARWLRPNAATRSRDQMEAELYDEDWAGMLAAFAPGALIDDRRPLFRSVVEAAASVDVMRTSATAGAVDLRVQRRLQAVFGDRLSLEQQVWSAGPDDGRMEIEMLALVEADAAGRVATIINFDPGDRRAAFAEANERWAALEPALAPLLRATIAYSAATSERDPARVRALLADDFTLHDGRRTGLDVVRGPDALLDSLRETWSLTRQSDIEVLARIAVAPWGSLSVQRVSGTLLDGGAFESLSLCTMVLDGDRYRYAALCELDDAERALASFAELRAEHEPPAGERCLVPPNAATRTKDRSHELARAGDWPALRALCTPDARFEDRRPLVRIVGDRDTLVTGSQHIGPGVWRRASSALLATSGDRLCLHRHVFKGDPASRDFEVETLDVTEVDREGNLVALLIFAPDDRRAAAVEMLERYMRGEGGETMPPAQIAFLRALQRHDLAAARAALDDDFAFVDHRRTGLGRLAGADEYVASLAAILEQSADLTIEVLYHAAVAEHGSMTVSRMFGTLRDGGGAFESPFVRINRYEGSRNVGVEMFEVDDLERATERFAELARDHAARVAARGIGR